MSQDHNSLKWYIYIYRDYIGAVLMAHMLCVNFQYISAAIQTSDLLLKSGCTASSECAATVLRVAASKSILGGATLLVSRTADTGKSEGIILALLKLYSIELEFKIISCRFSSV